MAEIRMETLIRQYDDLIQNRQKLLDHNFVEELLNVLSTCMNYQDTDAAQLYKNTNEYEGSEITHDEVAKSCMESEDQTKRYQILLNNNHVKKFLDFAIFLKTRNESDGKVNAALKSENDNLKNELEALKLHNLTLNSNLKLAHESLDEEKSQRKPLEDLSENLCSLLLKYRQRIQQLEEIKETTTRASSDPSSSILESDSDLVLRIDTSTSEDSLDGDHFSDTGGYDDDLPMSSLFDSRNDDTSPIIIGSNKESSRVKESQPAASDGTFNTDELANPVTPVHSQFTSDICRKSFSKESDLVCHKSTPMNGSQSFRCEKCGKSFMLKRRGQKLEKYPNCDVGCNTRSREKEPKLMSSSLETKKNGEFADDDHILTKCEKGNSSVRCDICGKSYSSNSTLKKHIREVHEGKKPFECNTCGQRFAQKVHLKTHTATHGSVQPFKCSVCNKCFRHLGTKRTHERVVHEGYARFHCAHCDKRCSRKHQLLSHIFSQHFPGTRKQFKCDICDKSFAIRQQLKMHKLVHTSQRSFKCSICNLRFKRHEHKLRHERNVHGENDRFHCAHCKKSYAYKMDLSLHLQRIHL